MIRNLAPLRPRPPRVGHGEAMPDPERRCPICGALLVEERRVSDAATGTAIPVWQCEKQQWWMQSTVHWRMPIDPRDMPVEEPTTVEDE
jgi:hypothetical protein